MRRYVILAYFLLRFYFRLSFIGVVIGGVVHVVVIIWNIIKGIQVLQESGGMYE
ncbi:hypothetical protein SAMN05216169_101832 [Anoxybacillus pushchinoensis]|uniref:Uncharacterized protein n=1 Tax=Anoxybacillus pushchinoensis TaxID=150248 RepID=A0A1I0TA70_9BACL|nr:hypothetical protein SAMN05216169_101832 [Anoxybacillus pushchinoensis]